MKHTLHASSMWPKHIMMLQRQLPVSFRTVASVAIHGTYSRQKTMNEIAPAGVKMLLSSENEGIPELLAITENVLMIASFAESPAIIADAACQLPNPSGSKKGATDLPKNTSMLSRQSETM